MGLDMYLYAEHTHSAGSEVDKVIRENLGQWRAFEADGVEGIYVSGWSFSKDPGYDDIIEATGVTPTVDSPSLNVRLMGDGSWVVRTTIFYWRKANAIHHWFVENCADGVDDCSLLQVHAEQLADLMEKIELVLENKDKAGSILPTTSGFFFGSTEYDEWYFADLETTRKNLQPVVNALPKPVKFNYEASW